MGNSVSGATVKIYTSETDFRDQKNQFGDTHFTDSKGSLTVTNVSDLKYYWFIEKDCKNNYNGGVTTTSSLILNKTNTIDAIISSTGTIKLTSLSNNPYKIYLNGTYVGDIEAKQTKSFYYRETGSYSIRVVQKSGYAVYPTDETYTGTLECGVTLNGSFPTP